MKKNYLVMIPVLVIFIGLVICCSVSRSVSPTDIPDFTLTAEEAMKPYKGVSTSIKAPEKYAGKLVAVTGFVRHFDKNSQIIFVSATQNEIYERFKSVTCDGFIPDSVKEISKGSKIKVMGIYDTRDLPSPILKNCVIIEGN